METNDLAILVQQGRTDLILELWERVKRYVRAKAYSRLMMRGFDNGYGLGGVTIDDLVQSGFLAMLKAVETHDPARANFITWLTFFLKTAFDEAQGLRNASREPSPLDQAISYYRPSGELEDETMADRISSEDSVAQDVETKIYRDQLHDAVELALREIPEKQAQVIRMSFLENRTLKQAGAAVGVTPARASIIRKDALRSLRRSKALREFLDERINYYLQVGPAQFIRTHQSSTEILALKTIRLKKTFTKEG